MVLLLILISLQNLFPRSLLMQVRFKIQSFSSQSQSFPIGNLLSKHSPWQSQRFCDYPQEITVSFYQPVKIQTIRIAAHPTKIPSRINILYHLPQYDNPGFVKYGFIAFSEGDPGAANPIEVKELKDVGVEALEVRFLLLRNHLNKHNFFNQVALSGLSFTGTPIDHIIPTPNSSHILTLSQTFHPQVTLFQQLKSSFVRRQQFQEAKQVQQVLNVIERANGRVEELQAQKQRLVKAQDFMGAKKIKQDIIKYRSQVTELVKNFYDPDRHLLKTVKSDEKLRRKVQELNLKNSSTFSEGSQRLTPRSRFSVRPKEEPQILQQQMHVVSEGEGEEEGEELLDHNESRVSHEDRILPAVMSRIKGLGQTQPIPQSSEIGDNQFFQGEKSQVLPVEPEQMSPADQANSSLLGQFYDSTFIRKLHSKHWQFRLQAIQRASEELKQFKGVGIERGRLRSYLFIYSLSLKAHNFQTATASLQLMNLLAPIKPQGDFRNDLHNELQHAIRATLRKLSDSNQKVRAMAEKTLLRIIESPIFGVFLCYSALIKSYSDKVSAKIRRIKIQQIQFMVEKYGVGQGVVPVSVADFALRAAGDQDSDVRKSSINLARAVKQRGGKQRLDSLLMDPSGVKASIAKQLSY